jgi:hypothetical protein
MSASARMVQQVIEAQSVSKGQAFGSTEALARKPWTILIRFCCSMTLPPNGNSIMNPDFPYIRIAASKQ